MENYKHKVAYYETDKMGVTHHSNYIRWMEEARVDFLDKIGFSYKKLEDMGAISPVSGVECEYKISTQFDDVVEIQVEVFEFKGVKLTFKYTIIDTKTGKVVAVGPGKVDDNGKLIPMNVEVGQKVIFQQYAGSTVKMGEEEYTIVSQDSILAVVE